MLYDLSSLTLAIALVTGVAVAGPGSSGNGLSAASIVAGLTRAAVYYGRLVADIRYGSLEADAARGTIILRDLEIAGLENHADCRISVGRVQMDGLHFWFTEEMRMRFDLSDVTIANACFGAQGAQIAMVTGGDSIRLASLSMDSHQILGSGAMRADFQAVSPGVARIGGSADFSYFTMYVPEFWEQVVGTGGAGGTPPQDPYVAPPGPGVRGTLRAAHLTVENLGVWERVQPMLPPDMSSPAMAQGLVTAQEGTALHDLQASLSEALGEFLKTPGMLTASIRPEAPVDFEISEKSDPEKLIALFKPDFSNTAPVPPVALIADPDAATDERALGLALAEGRGVPQNRARAIELLTPLAEDGEVALVLAGLMAEQDAVAAYAHAQAAAGTAVPGAAAALDRIEARLETAQLMQAQPAAEAVVQEGAFVSLAALRKAALAYETGAGVPRSYALARRLAASAAAAGDGVARALMARLDARFGADPAWLQTRAAAEQQALADWTGQNLASVLAGE